MGFAVGSTHPTDWPASARTMPAPPTMHRMEDIDRVRDYLTGLQDRICAAIEAVDGQATFAEDSGTRSHDGARADNNKHASGRGRTTVLCGGAVVVGRKDAESGTSGSVGFALQCRRRIQKQNTD